ncbi:hypothetical protein K440DRAFT_581387 [Wilcoxina mikolae CBS 423.85]|nr:hypothetical protein K440DRAFT_581387 [Wilcoxina mikolae CBS 423.85]
MFRPAARSVLRRNIVSAPLRTTYRQSRAFTVGGATEKKSSFKSTLLRWAAVGGIVYYYSTSSVFADEPKSLTWKELTVIEERPPPSTIDDERPPSLIDEVLARKNSAEQKDSTIHGEPPEKSGSEDNGAAIGQSLEAEGGAEELAEEASQEGAFNPETGEINWDCPCLGGMAHGPCGEQFRAAFSCFVYSTADPKGIECIDKFKDMQTCFQAHPDIYGAELEDEEEEKSSPATSSNVPTETANVAKPDAEPVDAKKSESLKPLDLDNVEETRSPATSSNVPTETAVDAGVAKPDTEPVDAKKPEDKVSETGKGIDAEQTKN